MNLHDFLLKLSPLLVSHLDELRPLHRRPLLQFRLPANIEAGPVPRSGPSIDQGQDHDLRLPLEDGRSLHVHVYLRQKIARAHIDDHDPRNSPLGHIGEDTLIGKWAKIGGAAGLATFGPGGAVAGALLGAMIGHQAEKTDPGPVWEWSPAFGVRPLTPEAFRCSRKT